MNKIFLNCACVFSVCIVLSCATPKRAANSVPPPPVQPSSQRQLQQTSLADAEYLRSVNDVDITRETFNEDKAEIMQIISDLAKIMAQSNYKQWLTYIDRESIQYWSNKQNLQRASRKLPTKGLQMNTLQDYFTYVFVPSRRGREVDEIRYDSKTDVKAVQMREDTDVIYYYFNKINGKWFVHIPPIEN
ncbi:MAG: hypothetical protein J6I73_09575 [Treponema sp.]|nr:hypothetical protein [Treponema sp.]